MNKQKNKIKAVIFDMDGLIVDSEIIESRSLELLLKIYNKEPKPLPNGLIHIVGPSGDQPFLEFIKKYNIPESLDEVRKKKHIIFEDLLKEKLTPMPGFLKLIKSLKENNIKIALASNNNPKFIHIIINNLGVKNHFEVIIGPTVNRKRKPFPDIYLDTAKELGVKPIECVVLEDTDIGIRAANAAGMKSIAVPNQYTLDHDFSKADLVTNSLENVTITMLNNI